MADAEGHLGMVGVDRIGPGLHVGGSARTLEHLGRSGLGEKGGTDQKRSSGGAENFDTH